MSTTFDQFEKEAMYTNSTFTTNYTSNYRQNSSNTSAVLLWPKTPSFIHLKGDIGDNNI